MDLALSSNQVCMEVILMIVFLIVIGVWVLVGFISAGIVKVFINSDKKIVDKYDLDDDGEIGWMCWLWPIVLIPLILLGFWKGYTKILEIIKRKIEAKKTS